MTQETERDKYAETIRCMSSVFDDIAAMLNLPKEQYGDPDALMDAIEALQEQARARLGKGEVGSEIIGLEITENHLWIGTMKLTPFGSKCDDIWFGMDYDKTLTNEAKQRRLSRAKLIVDAVNSKKGIKSIADLSPETFASIEKDCRVADVLAEKIKDSPCHLGQIEDAYHLANIAIETIKELALSTTAKPVEVGELVKYLCCNTNVFSNDIEEAAQAILSRYNVTEKGSV
ncbi:MAG: hypothetical protein ACK5X3_10530 [Pseudomonadota bacterium]|jgi:hypothetical protein